MSRKNKITSSDEAIRTDTQNTKPCGDCPFARAAIPGWLGGLTVEDWIRDAHGETRMDCHTRVGVTKDIQCAGAAIYRANVCKSPRDKSLLRLSSNRVAVFAHAGEFREHHQEKGREAKK